MKNLVFVVLLVSSSVGLCNSCPARVQAALTALSKNKSINQEIREAVKILKGIEPITINETAMDIVVQASAIVNLRNLEKSLGWNREKLKEYEMLDAESMARLEKRLTSGAGAAASITENLKLGLALFIVSQQFRGQAIAQVAQKSLDSLNVAEGVHAFTDEELPLYILGWALGHSNFDFISAIADRVLTEPGEVFVGSRFAGLVEQAFVNDNLLNGTRLSSTAARALVSFGKLDENGRGIISRTILGSPVVLAKLKYAYRVLNKSRIDHPR